MNLLHIHLFSISEETIPSLYGRHLEDVSPFVLLKTEKTFPSPVYNFERYYRIALEQQYYLRSSVFLSSSTLPFAGNSCKSRGKLGDDPVLEIGIALVLSVRHQRVNPLQLLGFDRISHIIDDARSDD